MFDNKFEKQQRTVRECHPQKERPYTRADTHPPTQYSDAVSTANGLTPDRTHLTTQKYCNVISKRPVWEQNARVAGPIWGFVLSCVGLFGISTQTKNSWNTSPKLGCSISILFCVFTNNFVFICFLQNTFP